MMVAPFQLAPSKQYHDGQAVLTYEHFMVLTRSSVYTIKPENELLLTLLILSFFLSLFFNQHPLDNFRWLSVLPTMSNYYFLT